MKESAQTDLVRLLDAASYAARQHRSQRRKGVDATPYINHPLEVARILGVAGVTDVEVLMAAILHDVIEDTNAASGDLLERFGERVTGMVEEVTDDKQLPKAERKRQQVLNAPGRSDGARMIKIADKIANLRDLVDAPPVWSEDRMAAYVMFAEDVARGCRRVEPRLDEMFDDAVIAVRQG